MNESVFTDSDLALLVQLAEGLTKDEVCDYFGVSYAELLPVDKEAVDRAVRKARANFLYYSTQKLKEQMTGRNGLQASLAALTRFGSQWEIAGESSLKNIKSFKIILDD